MIVVVVPSDPSSARIFSLLLPYVNEVFMSFLYTGRAVSDMGGLRGFRGGGFGVGGGVRGFGLFPVFSLLGNPLIDMDLRNACTCIESTLLYSCTFPQTCVF